ncbi:hypothetical protein BS50DRAFT_588856 [Corynespora cassiicola Philippines]|uniref:Zn(2)-C6 fungal-type domain-containing protein n=1 Tax=Corynespora cassiicola Philippines TaxID=1448308 RepID=A0A2T2NKY9_CORCC|nr:hypothetical protein BS50DRAFT_588856 [Corynespora cassiicola Philippines]
MLNRTRNSNRRNGKPASCEPCRLNKTKCDHTFPKCNRCEQRGIADKCFYHPAPLTKPREVGSNDDTETRPAKRRRASKRATEEVAYSASSLIALNDKFTDAVAAETYQPGYLGPTSYAAILPRDDDSTVPLDREASVSSDLSDRELSHQYPLTKSMRMQMATEVLRSFRYYPLIRSLVIGYCNTCQAGVVPTPLEVDIVEAIASTVDKFNLTNSSPDPRLVSVVLENSGKSLDIRPDLRGRDFYKLFTGDNLRIEALGWILATAGRSILFGFAIEQFRDPVNRSLKPRMTDEFLRSSTVCLMLSSLISPVNDATIWMFYENYLLTLMICGSSGPPAWRRLGELETQIYALGMHKESSSLRLPAFMLETRRRVFCSSYNQDKTSSTFLGRPIRMSKRHTDIKLPLDLSDSEIVGDEAALQLAIQSLDEEGWNKQGRYLRASWIRLRYMSFQYREEILDFALQKIDEDVERQLKDISRRIRLSWEKVPSHLRWPGYWDAIVPPSICVMLIVVHLTHFYNEFMIQKLLDHGLLTANAPLLRVSMDLLSNTLALGAIPDRSYDIYRDFVGVVLLFGIPSASVLATALKEQHHTGESFPPTISRAEIIRMLSVLISHLETAAQIDTSGARKGEANYDICRKAAKMFTKVIDAVLDNKPQATITPTSSDLELGLNFFNAPGLDGFEAMEFAPTDDGIDWGAFAQWTI